MLGGLSLFDLKSRGAMSLAISVTVFNENRKYRNNVAWPLLITGGDISRDGTKIILRSYNGKRHKKHKRQSYEHFIIH